MLTDKMANKIIPYRRDLKERAQYLRKNQTETESILWNRIRRRVLGEQFHRQVPMLDYIVDFYCHEIGLAIEIDGGSHNDKFFYDANRQERLEKEGVHFLRFTDKEIIKNIDSCIEVVVKIIEEANR